MRVSGPDAGDALAVLTRRSLPPARRATRAYVHGGDGEVLDDAIVLWFPGPASFTGEDVGELHVHGGRAVVAAVVDALAALPGLRIARPGEFSRRAFENGKLDLTAAEGLADLIQAETPAQRRQALRQMGGELARLYDRWRGEVIAALAHLEAAIDFSEEDLPESVEREAIAALPALITEIEGHLRDRGRGERLREGIRIAIVGAPNAGKSSLLNALARREAAIVSPHPGTTRDAIEVQLDLGGYPAVVVDTAGLRDASGEVEREGVRRSLAAAGEADLKLAVIDGALWPAVDQRTLGLVDDDSVVIVSKSDLGRVSPPVEVNHGQALAISVVTNDGVSELVSRLEAEVQRRWGATDAPALTRARHREALEACASALRRARSGGATEVAAEELRMAARAVGRITGRVDVEDVLDVVFADFCIGK